MQYKPGDQVLVRSDLSAKTLYSMRGEIDYECYAVLNMMDLASQVVTISRCTNLCYRVAEDVGGWNWTDEMFEGLAYDNDVDLSDLI